MIKCLWFENNHRTHSLPARGPSNNLVELIGKWQPVVEQALARCGRKNDLIVVGVGEGEATFNPLSDPSLSPAQIAQQLIHAASLTGQEASQRARGEDLFWATARTDVLTSLIELTQTTLRDAGIRTLTFAHLQRARALLSQSDSELKKMIAGVISQLSEASENALKEWARLPDNTRSCISSSVGNVLSP
jgi:hypothetical protein